MEERKIKAAECVKRLKKQQTLFTKQSTLQNSATEASFMVAHNLATDSLWYNLYLF
jgi:hypothetical protein